MVYITNWKFVSEYIVDSENIDIILSFLSVAKILIKKYWSRVFNEDVISSVSNINIDFASFLKILKSSWKLNLKDITSIVSLIKKSWRKYMPDFELQVVSDSIQQKLSDWLNASFWEVNLSSSNIDDLWIKLVWNNNYYKRTISSDLEKLVK